MKLRKLDITIGLLLFSGGLLVLIQSLGVLSIFTLDPRSISYLFLGISLFLAGFYSLSGLRRGINVLVNAILMLSFYFSGLLIIVVSVYVLLENKGIISKF
jgi:hypothetical protein